MPTYLLVSHPVPDSTLAWYDGVSVSARAFLADATALVAMLPSGGHVFNACADRYRFAVGLNATLVTDEVSLLPPIQTVQVVHQLSAFAPDVFHLHDATVYPVDLPTFRHPDALTPSAAPIDVPQIDTPQVMAVLFTPGSTSTPVPHRKTWDALVYCMRMTTTHLSLAGGHASTLAGTVPAQHMYSPEVTVLSALQGSLTFSNRQSFCPADVREVLGAIP